jgi:hypothetical protein
MTRVWRMRLFGTLGIERFNEADWPELLLAIRDATTSTSRAGGPVER